MRLRVSTPTKVVEDVNNLLRVRAEDDTGAFGIMPGHTDFVTVLPVSVVSWHGLDGSEGFVLVRQGVMTVRDGEWVEIAARGAYHRDDLQKLGETVEENLRRSEDADDVSRTSDTRMHLATIRQVQKVINSARGTRIMPPRVSSENTPTASGADQ